MNATVLPFPPPRNQFQFKGKIDLPEMTRWHNAVARYRHGLVMGKQGGRETGWINRANDGAESIHVYVGLIHTVCLWLRLPSVPNVDAMRYVTIGPGC